jgi:hypothetical protein
LINSRLLLARVDPSRLLLARVDTSRLLLARLINSRLVRGFGGNRSPNAS